MYTAFICFSVNILPEEVVCEHMHAAYYKNILHEPICYNTKSALMHWLKGFVKHLDRN